MANEAAIEVRREKVKRRLLRGMSTGEIAKQLDVSVRTVQADIQAVRQEGGLQLNKLNAQEFIALAAMKQDELERESWFIYHSSEATNADKLRALKSIQDIAKDRLEMYQAIGLLPSLDKTTNIAVGVSVGAERCADCPYKERFTKGELKAIVEGDHGEAKAPTEMGANG